MTPIRTIEEAQAAEKCARERFEATTTAFMLGDDKVTMAEARKVFEKYHHTPGTDWKRPVNVLVPYEDAEKFALAVEFYQGCKTRVRAGDQPVGFLRVQSPGYSC